MNKKVFSLLGMAFLGYMNYAQEKTQDTLVVQQLDEVVLDTKFKIDREKSGKVIYKITQKELQNVQGQSLAQTINTVSGIEITGSKSNQGSNLGYRIRGGSNNQVVILIDGIQVSDPSTIASDYDLRLLDVNLVESIEIIKGGVSTLYGTGATTAVISITTKKAQEEKAQGAVFMSVGSNRAVVTDKYKLNTATLGANVNGRFDKFNYLVSGTTESARGISAASSGTATVFEDDPFERTNGTIKLGYDFSDAFDLAAFVNYNKYKNQYDAGSSADAMNESESENIQIGLNPEFNYGKGSVVLNASIAKTERDFQRTSFPATYESNTLVADLFNKYKFSKKFWAVIGVNYQQLKMESATIPFGATSLVTAIEEENADVTLVDPYANVTYLSDFGLTVNGGVRLNNHSNYGTHLVYNINPSYVFNTTDKLRVKALASWSTSFIAPTLFQQYSPNYGNEDLDPQESANGEFGFEFTYDKKYRLSAVAYHREDENLIDFVNLFDGSGNWIGGTYLNISDNKIKTQGVEVEVALPLCKSLNFLGNYTFLQNETDVLSRRMPKHKVNISLSYVFKEKTSLSVAYQFTDKRLEGVYNSATFAVEDKVLDSYSLVNLFVNHQLTDNLNINASLFNAFDEEFAESFGYSTRGRNYSLGLTLKF